ncbi:MAG: NAD(+) synthase [Erysipelotrichaceae bacterium]|nr:NAD(+) synthase [Erysipelotrichaceae bacterium]
MTFKEYLSVIEQFIAEKAIGFSGYVLGLSGGVDSSLAAVMSKKVMGDKVLCLIMPCESIKEDAEDAVAIAKQFELSYLVINLTDSYRLIMKEMEKAAATKGITISEAAKQNVKVRLRMVTLYAFAQARNSLVIGTDNADEYYTGYFTKWGDGAADILPFIYLTKAEVIEAAKLYGLPDKFADRIPSAGLYVGQTDEHDMGVTYAELDAYLLGEEVDEKVVEKIENLHRKSAHKREPIPRPIPYERE